MDMHSPSLAIFPFFVSLLFIFFYFLILIVNKAAGRFLSIGFILALSMLSMIVIPNEFWDLARHYEFLIDIRNSNLGLREFLFNNSMRVGGTDFVSLISFNFIRYFIAHWGIDSFLPCVFTLIVYLIWYYISFDWHRLFGHTSREQLYEILLNMVLIPYLFVISGLRNTAAAAIVALAIYLNRVKRKNMLWTISLFAVACTIHMSSIYMILIFAFSLLKPQLLALLGVLIVTQIFPLTAEWAKNSGYEYLRKIGNSYLLYFGSGTKQGTSFYLIADLIVFLPFMWEMAKEAMTTQFQKMSFEKRRIGYFFMIFFAFVLCNIGKNTLIIRQAYTLGVLSAPLLSFFYEPKLQNQAVHMHRERMLLIIMAVAFVLVMRVSLPELLFAEWNIG